MDHSCNKIKINKQKVNLFLATGNHRSGIPVPSGNNGDSDLHIAESRAKMEYTHLLIKHYQTQGLNEHSLSHVSCIIQRVLTFKKMPITAIGMMSRRPPFKTHKDSFMSTTSFQMNETRV